MINFSLHIWFHRIPDSESRGVGGVEGEFEDIDICLQENHLLGKQLQVKVWKPIIGKPSTDGPQVDAIYEDLTGQVFDGTFNGVPETVERIRREIEEIQIFEED